MLFLRLDSYPRILSIWSFMFSMNLYVTESSAEIYKSARIARNNRSLLLLELRFSRSIFDGALPSLFSPLLACFFDMLTFDYYVDAT